MYVTKGKKITVKQVLACMEQRGTKVADYDMPETLVALNDALLHDRSVFAICTREPRSLDSGRHWYDVKYVDAKGRVQTVWFPSIMDKTNTDTWRRKYGWSSRAIGMSRVMDATDNLFTILKKCGGCYAQIDCL